MAGRAHVGYLQAEFPGAFAEAAGRDRGAARAGGGHGADARSRERGLIVV